MSPCPSPSQAHLSTAPPLQGWLFCGWGCKEEIPRPIALSEPSTATTVRLLILCCFLTNSFSSLSLCPMLCAAIFHLLWSQEKTTCLKSQGQPMSLQLNHPEMQLIAAQAAIKVTCSSGSPGSWGHTLGNESQEDIGVSKYHYTGVQINNNQVTPNTAMWNEKRKREWWTCKSQRDRNKLGGSIGGAFA